MKLKKNEVIIMCLVYGIICLLYYYFAVRKVGPSIFGDEAEYLKLARNLHYSLSFTSNQYNILYPFFISFCYFFPKITMTVDFIKILNVCMMASTVIPTYAIVRRMISTPIIRYCVTIAVALLPWCGTSVIIWAEPLFYPMSLWAAYFFFSYIKKKSVSNIVKLAIGCTLLYLTKQAGLVFILAVEFAIIYDFILNCKDKRKDWGLWFSAILANIVPTLLQMLVNKLNNQPIMGYSQEITGYLSVFTNIRQFMKAFLFQVSDVVLMSYFIFAVLFIITLIEMKRIKRSIQPMYVMIALWTIGIMLLAALHRMNRDESIAPLTMSRYTCIVIPYILMIGLKRILDGIEKGSYRCLMLCACILAFICICWSPVKAAVYAYGYNTCFGMSYMTVFVYNWNKVSWTYSDISILYTVIPLLIYISLGGVCILINNRKIKMVILSFFLVLSIFSGVTTIRMVTKACGSSNTVNMVYRFLLDSKIEMSDVYMDEDCIGKNTQYLNDVWCFDDEFNDDLSDAKYLISLDSQLAYEMIYSNSKYYIYYLEEDPMNQ